MKILVVGDVHYSVYSSIVRGRGEYYSKRLENLLWSINWAEKTAEENQVDLIVYLGDFFDRSDLNAEEITAFRDIKWASNINHKFLVGNHEIGARSLEYNSARLIEALGPRFQLIDEPYVYSNAFDDFNLVFIPYTFENDRIVLSDYMKEQSQRDYLHTYTYMFSHNDIKGVQYGMFESVDGFEKQDILDSCDLFINGHIHNGEWIVPERILNLGNLTGQNFNEDAMKYSHNVLLIDTDEKYTNAHLQFITNPYAFDFLKLEITEANNPLDLRKGANGHVLNHMVLSIKCPDHMAESIRNQLDKDSSIEAYKLISTREEVEEDECNIQTFNSIDHLQQFQSYILSQLGKSEVVVGELQEVLK